MGFWGSYVVCRSPLGLDQLKSITSRDDGLLDAESCAAGWQLGSFGGSFIADGAEDLVADLAGETGTPALTGFVMDSDCIDLWFADGVQRPWRACLARQSMAAYLLDMDQAANFDAVFPGPADAALKAADWSRRAGLLADPGRTAQLFATLEGEPFAEPLFFELLEALGIGPSSVD